MLRLSIDTSGNEKLARAMKELATGRIREEAAAAMNIVAHKHVVPAMRRELQKFDRVTPFVERSVRLVKAATPDDLTLQVGPSYRSALGSEGGKVGVDPQDVLQAQQLGGYRRDKRSEKRLRQVGWLPSGMQVVVPDPAKGQFPGSVDAYGNIRGPFMQQLLSYLQAYQDSGHMQNMSDQKRARMHSGRKRPGKNDPKAPFQGPARSQRYFVIGHGVRTTSSIVGGEQVLKRTVGRQNSRLRPGIYAQVGTQLHAVLMFVPLPRYQPKVDLSMRAMHAQLQDQVARTFRARVYEAVEKAARA